MKINIINPSELGRKVEDFIIVIDVLRAFTTACYAIKQGASRLIIFENEADARRLKKEHPEYILIGERHGLKIKGAEHNNSPYEVAQEDFRGKTALLTTTAGTKALTQYSRSREVITGAFVNASAVVGYINTNKINEVSLVCTDDKFQDGEDYECAKYIKSLLTGKEVDIEKIKIRLRNHPSAFGFIKKPLTKYGPEDFKLCLQFNKFDFILRAKKVGRQLFLEPINAPIYGGRK